MRRKIVDYHIHNNHIFYRLDSKVPLNIILNSKLYNEAEKKNKTLVTEHYENEEHYLTDYNACEPFEGYENGCCVEFEITGSRYHPEVNSYTSVRNIFFKKPLKKIQPDRTGVNRQENNSGVIITGENNAQVINNNNTTIYISESSAVNNTASEQTEVHTGPIGKLVKSIAEITVKTVISTVITALMSGDLKSLNIPEFANLHASVTIFILWLGIYGIASLLVWIFRFREKRFRSTLLTAFALLLGLSFLQTELVKNGRQDIAKALDVVLSVFVFSLIIVDVVILVRKVLSVIRDRKSRIQIGTGNK